MINEEELASMLTTNQSRTLYVLLYRPTNTKQLTEEAYNLYRDDTRFRNCVAQSVGGVLQIVKDTYHHKAGLNQKKLGGLLTSQQGVLIHALLDNKAASDNEMDVVQEAAERYETDPGFREVVGQSVGAIMSVVMHCDSRENLVEVPAEVLENG